MVKVIKGNGKKEDFSKEKIAVGCQKAGADIEDSSRVADSVEQQVKMRKEISSREIGEMVIQSLRKVDQSTAKSFETYFKQHMKHV